MRVNTANGAWVCMSCGAKGGDVIAHRMQAHSQEFIQAVKSLCARVNDGKAMPTAKPLSASRLFPLEVSSPPTTGNCASVA